MRHDSLAVRRVALVGGLQPFWSTGVAVSLALDTTPASARSRVLRFAQSLEGALGPAKSAARPVDEGAAT